MDDLDRYLNKENRNEEINRETRGKSNFQELY